MIAEKRIERCEFVIKLKCSKNSDGFSKSVRNSLCAENVFVSNWANGGSTVRFVYDGNVRDVQKAIYKRLVGERVDDDADDAKYSRREISIKYSYVKNA